VVTYFWLASVSRSYSWKEKSHEEALVKAWTTLDVRRRYGDDWWQDTNSPERMRYVVEQYSNAMRTLWASHL